MKLRFIYVLFFSAFALIFLQSKRFGPAANGVGDKTGSPLSFGADCSSCHSGAFNNTALVVRVKNTGGTVVTSYTPGASYTIEFAVTSSSSFTYGFQGVVLRGANLQAGTLGTPISANTQVTTFNGRQYAEHSTPAIAGGGFTFIVPWTAPTVGSGNVTVYADGVTVNGNNSTSGDDPAGPVSVVLTETAAAAINYTKTSYCNTESDPTPTITGIQGGTFSATPSGLSLNPTTGTIDVSASTVNQTYTITYTYAGGTTTDVVTIYPLDDATFSYAQSSYCNSGSDPTPTITGLPGGNFLSVPGGLSIHPTTGTIDVSASTLGSYTVGYQTNGPCSDVGTFAVTITNLDNASFAYGNSSYCQNGVDPTPTATTGGGIYSSTGGLSISASTGLIDLSASIQGTYTITYTTAGGCSNSSNQVVTINGLDNASFAYANSTYCQNVPDPTPTITGLPSGFFTATPSGLVIDTWTGVVDVSASTLGTYTITYTTNGSCPNSSNQSFTVAAIDNASFTYGGSSFCQNTTDPTPTFSVAGTWSSSPAGLSINTSTGAVDVSASAVGTYTIVHTTTGPCPNSSNQPLTIVASDNASFTYGGASFCQNGTNKTPTFSTAGTWSATPAGLSINASTGVITVGTSTVGSYTITHTTTGACPSSSNQVVAITAADNASFTYGGASFCQNGTNKTPTFPTAGTWSATPAGLSINASTGVITVGTSTVGSYTITHTTTGACPSSSNQVVAITAADNASFTYGGASFCQNGTNKTPTFPTAGTWSSTPAGLSINASTGVITVGTSTIGSYTITHTTTGACPSSSNQVVAITAADNASFTYGGASFCQNGTNKTPTFPTAGTWSATPAGLSINASTGVITVGTSTVGSYTITHTTTGACPSSSNQVVAITAADNASFTYGGASFCQNGADRTPTFSVAGTWSATPAGLSINASSGVIDVSASSAGSYTVIHTTTGTCPSSSNQNVTIVATDNASFSYANSSYCQNGTDPTPSITGTAGIFSSTAGLSIGATSGMIDVSASALGTYNVTYTTTGACPSSSVVVVTITAADNALFTYGGNNFCQNGADPSPMGGLPGGTWSATPSGLSIGSTSGTIDVSTSAVGSYNVTYTTNGACPSSNSMMITIASPDNASFSYNSSSACQNGSDLTATITGLANGTFSSTAGLSIGATSGLIDVSASTAGTYNVTYTTNGSCPNSSMVAVTIVATDNASFTYGGASFCQNATDPVPTVGLAGGTWSATPSGLSISPTSGVIDVSASTVGSYNVTYTTNGACPSSTAQSISITSTGNSTFSYASATYCTNNTDPSPTIGGNPGGVFSSTTGLVISASTGVIDVSASTVGSYVVTYTVSGSCPSSSTFNVSIGLADNASFAYANSAYCQNGSDPTPTITGTTGMFSSTSGLSISPTSGMIDVSASTAGTYNVTYTTNGACPNTNVVVITINATDNASFTYGGNTFCQNGLDATPMGGFSGGTWSATPSGLSISATSGMIDVSASTAGAYNVTYTSNGICPSSNSMMITVLSTDNASFSYVNSSYCQNGSDPTPTITGTTGTFSSTTGLTISASTGVIDLSASTVGNYNVTYTTNGVCPSSSVVAVSVTAADNAAFTFGGATFCQNATDPTPTIAGTTGVFSSSPVGLIFDANTGVIDVSASAVGNYTFTYTTNGVCPNSFNQMITITATGDASFNYASSSYCQNLPNESPMITGNPGGIFSSTSGLIINSSTGEIDLGASTAGTYTVTYAVTGACPSSSNVSVTLVTADVASFAYADTSICLNVGANPILSVTGTTSGSYSVDISGLVFANNLTGEINLAGSTAGNYVVTYTSNGVCPAIVSVNVDLSVCGGVTSLATADLYQLYPNPNEGIFTIENNGSAGNVNIQIRDVLGRVVHTQEQFMEIDARQLLDVPTMTKGVYWVEIQKGANRQTLKMIVSE